MESRFSLDDNATGAENSVNEIQTLIYGKRHLGLLQKIPALIMPIRHAGQKIRAVACASFVRRALDGVGDTKLDRHNKQDLIEAFAAVFREYYHPRKAAACCTLSCMEDYWPELPFDRARWIRNNASVQMFSGEGQAKIEYLLDWSETLCSDSINQNCNIAVSWTHLHIRDQRYQIAFETIKPWYQPVLRHPDAHLSQPLTCNNRIEVVWITALLALAVGDSDTARDATARILGLSEWYEPHWERGVSFVEPTFGFFNRLYAVAGRQDAWTAGQLRNMRTSHGRSPLTSNELTVIAELIGKLAE